MRDASMRDAFDETLRGVCPHLRCRPADLRLLRRVCVSAQAEEPGGQAKH